MAFLALLKQNGTVARAGYFRIFSIHHSQSTQHNLFSWYSTVKQVIYRTWLTRGNSGQTFGTFPLGLQKNIGFLDLNGFSLVQRELGWWLSMMNSESQQELVVGYFTAYLQHIPVRPEKNHEYLPGYSASVLRTQLPRVLATENATHFTATFSTKYWNLVSSIWQRKSLY